MTDNYLTKAMLCEISRYRFSIFYFSFLFFLILTTFLAKDWFGIFNVPLMKPIFADIRTIAGVNETLTQGLDPLVSNPGDPWGRAMNYPRIWEYFAVYVGLNQENVIYFGFLNIAFFVFGVYFFMVSVKRNIITILLVGVLLLSPASMLLLERGNIDTLIFFLLSLMVVARRKVILSLMFLICATLLKIFPLFSLPFSFFYLSYSKRSFFSYVIVFTVLSFAMIYLTYDDLVKISSATPSGLEGAYGLGILPALIEKYSFYDFTFIFYGFIFLWLLALLLITARGTFFSAKKYHETAEVSFFRVGASIYIFTFFVSHNWDYRLVFLIFTIPFLVSLLFQGGREDKVLSFSAIVSIVVSFNFFNIFVYFPHGFYVFIDEVFNWLLFLCMSFYFFRLIPERLFEVVPMFRIRR